MEYFSPIIRVIFSLAIFANLSVSTDHEEVIDDNLPELLTYPVFQRTYRNFLETGQRESCFVFDLEQDHHLSVEFAVLNSDPNNGHTYTVQFTIRDYFTQDIIVNLISSYFNDWDGFLAQEARSMEVCFINYDVVADEKIISWQVVIHGKDDHLVLSTEEMNAIIQDNESTEEMKSSVSKVAHRMIDSQRNIWGIRGMQMQSFLRMEAVQQMIDTWSLAHACLVVAISVTQAFVLKKMFSDPKIQATRLKVRT